MIAAIIQARMGSTRLPGKVLKRVLGKTLLEHLILRVKRSRALDTIIVATTARKEDAAIARLAKSLGVGVYRGSVDDVLDRYYKAAKEAKADTIVRLTGDCPLMDPTVIDRCVDFYKKNHFDYVSNANPPTFPDGMDVEVFSFTALQKAWREAKRASDREHVTPFIRDSGSFKTANVRNETNASSLRLTVDEARDLALMRKLIGFFAKRGKKDFDLKEIIALWRKRPDFFRVNQSIKRNEGYRKSLMKDAHHAAGKEEQTIMLRKATVHDARFLYDLRNEKVVRQASFGTNPISWKDHRRWFQEKLAGSESAIFIAEIDGAPAGQARLDFREDGGTDINIAISQDFRGKGYGSKVVKSASEHFFAIFPKTRTIHAFIKLTNKASLKVFAEAGYCHSGNSIIKGQPCVDMKLELISK